MFQTLSQEIILSGAALLLMVVEMLRPQARKGSFLIAVAAVAAALFCWQSSDKTPLDFFALDSFSYGFSFLILAGTGVALLLSQVEEAPKRQATFYALVLLASVGCLLLVKTSDFLYAFLAIELISLCSFILVAYERKETSSLEGAVKYFLVGAFSAAIALYGISLYYAATGTTSFKLFNGLSFAVLPGSPSGEWLALAGITLVFVSFAFKASIAPFHFWVPDAYQAAPTAVTAYLSVVPKLASMGAMLHIFVAGSSSPEIPTFLSLTGMGTLVAILACLTMTVGNVSAIHQTDLKRLLAYSSIAQAGYMMMGLLAATELGTFSVLFYGFTYLFMNFGAFACIMWIARRREGSYDLDGCNGLAVTHFPFALTFVVFLLSLAGIPPMAGFLGKYLLFASLLQAKTFLWVAVVGALNSVISVYYYLRIAYRMFFVEGLSGHSEVPALPALTLALALLLAGTIVFGVYPNPLLALAGWR